ncbi:MAG: hypothetical protein K8F91_15240, partial [Candidatus Obscuribacterales bacterium]|nr:hypothetical protein [Candidatus Obscuribacterales bacterium]
ELLSGAPGPQDLFSFASDLPRPPLPHELLSSMPSPQDVLDFGADLPRPPLPHELLGLPSPLQVLKGPDLSNFAPSPSNLIDKVGKIFKKLF